MAGGGSKPGERRGGRKKGTPNKVTASTRERIEKEGDPVGFLCRVVKGLKINGEKPTLDQRKDAAKKLIDKTVADLKAIDVVATLDDDLAALIRAARKRASAGD